MSNTTPDLAALLPSWQLALRAERKSPATVKTYTEGIAAFLRWSAATGTPAALDRTTVQEFVVYILDSGQTAKTASTRLLPLKRFSAWLVEEGELDTDELVGVKQPKLDRKVVNGLTEVQLRALVAACKGKGFTHRRDEAIVRLLAETGMRAGELLALHVDDVDHHRGIVTIHRGKGGKGRIVPFGAQTGQAIDRYLRMRRTHKLAHTPTLWLGADDWRVFNYFGLRHTLRARAESAGIKDFHPHLMRHTAATRWLAAGGSEGGLMAVAGWSNRAMLDRYTAATASERAATEARGLALGDI
ncbi:tyrosine-type recombinase/integrase [Mycobacterium sp. BMJ-28]